MLYFDRFDICEAYYLFLSEYHGGQYSYEYYRLSHMLTYFKPSWCLDYEHLTENGQDIYDNLVNKYNEEV